MAQGLIAAGGAGSNLLGVAGAAMSETVRIPLSGQRHRKRVISMTSK